jgi:hypothetical protein
MFDEILGIPAHPLIVHVAAVLVPLLIWWRSEALGAVASRCELVGLGLCAIALVPACETFHYCDPPPPERIERAPSALSKTGLFTESATRTLADGVRPFRPEFALWSDGASKQRWVYLPEGETIDTRDMNNWRFPVGTKFWKEFRDGDKPVETRLLEKLGPGDAEWLTLSYLWTEDERDALAVPQGAIDARDTALDVPAAGECAACHGGRRSFVLGFSAIQLSHGGDDLDLEDLVAAGLLSDPPGTTYAVPGDDRERNALGYLHANCGHCHNQDRPVSGVSRCFDPDNELDFWLRVELLDDPEQTPTYGSAVGSVVIPGEPGNSRLIELVSRRGIFQQMPPLATERVDREAVEALSTWILELERR